MVSSRSVGYIWERYNRSEGEKTGLPFETVFYHAILTRSPRNDNLLAWLDWVASSRRRFVDRRWVSGFLDVDVEIRPKFKKGRIGLALRRLVLQKGKNQCWKCKKRLIRKNTHIHHLAPEVKGGKTELENLVALCVDCHKEAHADPFYP
jgi:5-methylcytosine-specific restriction endonuclease McrA